MRIFIVIFLAGSFAASAQQIPPDSLKITYQKKLETISNDFSAQFYPNRTAIYSLKETSFLKKIDSLRLPFENLLSLIKKINGRTKAPFIANEEKDIDYLFDRIVEDYPYFHEVHTGEKVSLSKSIQQKLDKHLADFNNPALLKSKDVQEYIKGFLRHQSTIEVKKARYRKSDNKRLDAYIKLLPTYFTNQACKEYWYQYYIANHLDNWGSKHLENVIAGFKANCKNGQYLRNIDSSTQKVGAHETVIALKLIRRLMALISTYIYFCLMGQVHQRKDPPLYILPEAAGQKAIPNGIFTVVNPMLKKDGWVWL